MQESIKYIDKFCKLNASRLKIGAIKKILKEGYDIVAKRKIIPGYKNSDLSRSKEEAEKLNSKRKKNDVFK